MKISKNGYYGEYGGCFNPEILQSTFEELIAVFEKVYQDATFWQEYVHILQNFSCRPTPITFANQLTEKLGGAKIYIKREDLNQTGAHKLNNVIGQGLITKRMKKSRVIAETGAGQHGIATATMAAKFGFDCTIYMGEKDVMRQRPNVFWMEKLGAEVIPVTSGSAILKDAINEAFRDWVNNVHNTHYVLGTACGPHPYPSMVAWLQSIISKEIKEQFPKRYHIEKPDKIYACVGGGSNAIGVFYEFIDDKDVELIGVEAGGHGLDSGMHATRITSQDATVGIAQGYKTRFLQNQDGQMRETHSVSAGLDYVGISPILAFYADQQSIRFESITDQEVMSAMEMMMKYEGLIPALESTHAIAQALKEAPKLSKETNILINMSGRGDKDIFTIADAFQDENWKKFILEKIKVYES